MCPSVSVRTATVTLQSSDGVVLTVDATTANYFITINTMIELLGYDENEIIPLPNVTGDILQRCIEWVEHHKNNPEEYAQAQNHGGMTEWDLQFLDVELQTLYDLINAANYLNIEQLYQLTCEGVARLMYGKTPFQMRELFGLPTDPT